jgi:hypothetical protein
MLICTGAVDLLTGDIMVLVVHPSLVDVLLEVTLVVEIILVTTKHAVRLVREVLMLGIDPIWVQKV